MPADTKIKILVTPRSFGKTKPDLFEQLQAHGCEVVRNTTGAILKEEQLKDLLAPCAGIIVGVDPLTEAVLEHAPKLCAIAKYGVGLDNIDLDYCAKRKIAVSRTLGANSNAVADYAFTLMLMCARKAALINNRCHAKDWSKITSLDLYGKTLGIIGLGAVGKCVAARAKGFAMNILAYDVFTDEAYAAENGITYTDLETLLKTSDVISLHAQLTSDNHKMLNAQRLSLCKPTAIIINTARGDLVDEDALLQALSSNAIFAAGIDVFTKEPPDNPLWYSLDNVVLGSHCASSTKGATETMGQMAVDNLLRDLNLNP